MADSANKLYNALTQNGLDLGTEEEFRTKMGSSESRKKLYEAVTGRGLDIGTYEEFDAKMNESIGRPGEVGQQRSEQNVATANPTINDSNQVTTPSATQPTAQQTAQQTAQPTAQPTTQPTNQTQEEGILSKWLRSSAQSAGVSDTSATDMSSTKNKVDEEAKTRAERSRNIKNNELTKFFSPYVKANKEGKDVPDIFKKPISSAEDSLKYVDFYYDQTHPDNTIQMQKDKIDKLVKEKIRSYHTEYLSGDYVKLIDSYTEAFKQTPEYKEIEERYANAKSDQERSEIKSDSLEVFSRLYEDEINAKVNEELEKRYSGKIEDYYKSLAEQMQSSMNDFYKSPEVSEWLGYYIVGLGKANVRRDVNANKNKIDSLISSHQKEYYDKVVRTPYNTEGRGELAASLSDKQHLLRSAENLNKQSEEMISAAENGKGFFGGMKDSLTNPDNWLAGVIGLVDSVRALEVVKKAEKGEELTAEESLMMDAMCNLYATQCAYNDDISGWYNAGKGVGDTIPFMASFIMTGGLGSMAESAGKGTAKAVASGMRKFIMNKARKELAKAGGEVSEKAVKELAVRMITGTPRKAMNFAARFAGWAVEGALRQGPVAAVQMAISPTFYKNIIQNSLLPNVEHGEDGGYTFNMDGKKTLGEETLDQFIEFSSENFGVSATEAATYIAGLGAKALKGKAQTLLDFLQKVGKAYTKVGKYTGMGDIFGEVGEEYWGAALRYGTGLDANGNDLKTFFDADKIIPMIAQFAPQMILGGIGVSAAHAYKSYDRSKSENSIRQVLESNGVSSDAVDNYIKALRSADIEQINNALEVLGVDITDQEAVRNIVVNSYNVIATSTALEADDMQNSVEIDVLEGERIVSATDGNEEIRNQTNVSNDKVQNVIVAGLEGACYVKKGNLVTTTDKDGNIIVDKEKSDKMVVVVDKEGKPHHVSVDKISQFVGEESSDALIQANEDRETAEIGYAEAFPVGSIVYNPNMPGQLGAVHSTNENGFTMLTSNETDNGVSETQISGEDLLDYKVMQVNVGDVFNVKDIPLTIENIDRDMYVFSFPDESEEGGKHYDTIDADEFASLLQGGGYYPSLEDTSDIDVSSEEEAEQEPADNRSENHRAFDEYVKNEGHDSKQTAYDKIAITKKSIEAELEKANEKLNKLNEERKAMPDGYNEATQKAIDKKNADISKAQKELNDLKAAYEKYNALEQGYNDSVNYEQKSNEDKEKSLSLLQDESAEETYQRLRREGDISALTEFVSNYLDGKGLKDVYLTSNRGIVRALRGTEGQNRAIKAILNGMVLGGVFFQGTQYINVENVSLESVVEACVHERQHALNADNKSNVERLLATGITVDEMKKFIGKMSGTKTYDSVDRAEDLADEYIAFASQLDNRNEDGLLEKAIGRADVAETLNNIFNGQRENDNNLGLSRRGSIPQSNTQQDSAGELREGEGTSSGVGLVSQHTDGSRTSEQPRESSKGRESRRSRGGEGVVAETPATTAREQVEGEKQEYTSRQGESTKFQLASQSDNAFGSLRRLKKGEFCKVEVSYEENGFYKFSSKNKIETIDDVAYIFKQLENQAVEHTFIALIKDGHPTIVQIGMGSLASSLADSYLGQVAVDAIKPDAIYLVHNHPSGNLSASYADKDLFSKFENMYPGVATKGYLIIDSYKNQYSQYDSSGQMIDERSTNINAENTESVPVYTFSKKVFRDMDNITQVRKSEDVAGFIASQRLGTREKLSALVLDRQNNIIGNIHIPYKITDGLNGISQYITPLVAKMGSTSVLLYGNEKSQLQSHNKELLRLQNLLKRNGITLLDAVSIESDLKYDSANDRGVFEDEAEYTKDAPANATIEQVEERVKHVENEVLGNNGIYVDRKKGDVAKFSINYSPMTSKEEEMEAKLIAKYTGKSLKECRRYVKSQTKVRDFILELTNRKYLDYIPDDSESSIKDNSDYGITVDFTNVCRKRAIYTHIIDEIQRRNKNAIITGEMLAEIRQKLAKNNYEVACALCYVEDRRQLLGEIAQAYIDELVAKRNGIGSTKKEGFVANVTDEYTPTIYDLITEPGMRRLRAEHPQIAESFVSYNNSRGQQAGRLNLGTAEYKREILDFTKSTVSKYNNHGGLRIFSFSDFEVPHLIDLIQIVQDCSTKGLMIQTYTKVPELAKFLANTGVKVNRSLIPSGDGLKRDSQGNVIGLEYDTIEGIDINHKDFFDSTDNKNIGNVLVGVNDEHIRRAFIDDFVDYIIPYHTGQRGTILVIKGIDKWTNYKNFQTEKWLDKNRKKKCKGVNIYTDVLQGAEKEGNPIKTADQFVKKFLDVCKEKGMRPRFAQFLDMDSKGDFIAPKGYHKLLLDYKLFDKDGNILPQEIVRPEFDDEYNMSILQSYVDEESLKEAEGFRKDKFVNEIIDKLELDNIPSAKFQIVDKNAQYDIIKNTNQMQDGYHTGIRSVSDIKTFEEAYEDNDRGYNDNEQNIENAKKTGKVTIYSSKPIEQGSFVSTSKMMAGDYAGGTGSDIYTREVPTSSVAWINLDEGQYADTSNKKYKDKVVKDNGVRFQITGGASNIDDEKAQEEEAVRFSIVSDKSLIAKLEQSEKMTGYRNVVLNEDGTFGSPMASGLRTKGKGKVKTTSFEIGKWEQADENPALASEEGKIDLVKPDGKSVGNVDYNPYIHNRLSNFNYQFKQAWERPNLVYVQTEIPTTDLESGYHADKAKLGVGVHDWSGGGKLVLSRYDKPVAIVPWEKVADDWMESDQAESGFEWNRIPSQLLPILVERGAKILPPTKNMGKECVAAYEDWQNKQKADSKESALQQSERGREQFHGATSTESLDNEGKVLLTNDASTHRNLNAKLVNNFYKAKKSLAEFAKKGYLLDKKCKDTNSLIRSLATKIGIDVRNFSTIKSGYIDYEIDTTSGKFRISNHNASGEFMSKGEDVKDRVSVVVYESGKHINDGTKPWKEFVFYPDIMSKNTREYLDENNIKYKEATQDDISVSVANILSNMLDGKEPKDVSSKAEQNEYNKNTEGENSKALFQITDTGIKESEAYDLLYEIVGNNGTASEILIDLEKDNGGEIKYMSNGARNALKEGRVPYLNKGRYIDGEWHHVMFKNDEGESFVERIPFYELDDVIGDDGEIKRDEFKTKNEINHLPFFQITSSSPKREDGESPVEYFKRYSQWIQERKQSNDSDINDMIEQSRTLRGKLSSSKLGHKHDVALISGFINSALRTLDIDSVSIGKLMRAMNTIRSAVGSKDLEDATMQALKIVYDTMNAQSVQELKEAMSIPKMSEEDKRKLGSKKNAVTVFMEQVREYTKQDLAKIVDREGELNGILTDENSTESQKEDAKESLYALELVKQLKETMRLDQEINELNNKRKELEEENTSEMTKEEKEQRKELIDSIKKEVLFSKMELVDIRREIAKQLVNKKNGIRSEFDDFIEEKEKHRNEIRHAINSDLRHVDLVNDQKRKSDGSMKKAGKMLTSSLHTLDYELRKLGLRGHNLNGEGRMWRYFNPRLNEASSKEFERMRENYKMMDEKCEQIFGKDWRKTMNDISNKPIGIQIKGLNEEAELTAGQAAYIYAVNKMVDGKMKLRAMGITDQDIENIQNSLPVEMVTLTDWIQDEFLPKLRERYNETHKRMFGVSMGKIDNYIPLRISSYAIDTQDDIANNQVGLLPSTITGSLIHRTTNTKAIDVANTDIMDMVLEHIQKMEHWDAYAEVIDDLNQVINNKRFKMKMDKIDKDAFGWFKDAAQISTGNFKTDKQIGDELFNTMKLIGGAKVALRLSPAVKQLLSVMTNSATLDSTYHMSLTKNLATPKDTIEWCMNNLPLLQKRWESKMMGNEKLDFVGDSKSGALQVIDGLMKKYGLAANSAVDLYVCSSIARATYDQKAYEYIKRGMPQEDAHVRAINDAENAYNMTQQSAEGQHMSRIQNERGFVSTAMSLFNNSSFAYGRRFALSCRETYDVMKNKKSYIERREQTLHEDYPNLDEATIKQMAEKDVNRGLMESMLRIGMFGYVVNLVWNLGGSWFELMFGDDPDKKKKAVKDAAVLSIDTPLRNTTYGKSIEWMFSLLTNGGKVNGSFGDQIHPMFSQVTQLTKDMSKLTKFANGEGSTSDIFETSNHLVQLIVESKLGVTPSTIYNVAEALADLVMHVGKGDITWLDIKQDFGMIASVPPSQIRNRVLTPREGETMEEYINRYVWYKKTMKYGMFSRIAPDLDLTKEKDYIYSEIKELREAKKELEKDKNKNKSEIKRLNKIINDANKKIKKGRYSMQDKKYYQNKANEYKNK